MSGQIRHHSSARAGETWLTGGGELGRLVREKDWSLTPLGPVAAWPPSLRTTVGILLHSPCPMCVFWGPELVAIYNDAYRPIAGPLHPAALGQRGSEMWTGTWRDIKPLVDRALAGESTRFDEGRLVERGAPPGPAFACSFSPVWNESGDACGVICACTEPAAAALAVARVRRESQERLAAVSQDLQRRLDEFETLLRVIPIGIGIALDPECRTIQTNPAFAATLGLPSGANASLSAPEGDRPTTFVVRDVHGRDVPPADLPMQVAAREGRVVSDVEFDIVRRDGRIVRLLEFAVPLLDEESRPRGSIGAFVDISDRREAEVRNQLLVRFDDEVRGLRDPDAIIVLATRLLGEHLEASRSAYADVEEDGEHVVIQGEYRTPGVVGSIAGRWELSKFGQSVAADLRSGRTVVVNDVARDRPDSAAAADALGMRASVAATAMRDGRLCAMLAVHAATPREWRPAEVGLVQAVTRRCWEAIARARAVRALTESEERFRTMADSAPVIIWVTDADGACSYLNHHWYELTGETPESSLGAGWLNAVHPDDRTHVEERFLEANARREPLRIEYRLRRVDGSYRWVIDSSAPRVDPTGGFAGFVGSVIDITDRQELEASLRQTNRLKDEFLATLSHELRTPLNAMLGWTHMIRTGSLDKDVEARALASLERNVRAQAQLVDDLLDVSRIVSGKMRIKTARVELHRVIAAAVETIQPAALSRRIALRWKVNREDPVVVLGDPDRLRQVVWNLLSNAVKFTPAGGRVRIDLLRTASVAKIVVRDSGQGILPEFLPYVFDRFRQGDGTTTRRHGGLGLGLAIVAHLTEAHGGTVSAESGGIDGGSTFTVQLPLAADAARRKRRPRPSGGGTELHGARILVVDDEPDARDLLRVILETAGAQVADAGSAGEALDHLRVGTYDLLVADIAMPEQDGLSLARAVRASEGSERGIPAIAVTAYASERERQAAFQAGYGWHLAKPVEPARLVATAKSAIENASRGAAGSGRG